MSERVDRLGALASTLCAVHCAACALLPAAFGALGLGFLLGHEIEWAFTLIAVALATGALVFGWRRHRSRPVVLLLALGIVGLLVSRGIEMGSEHHEHATHEPVSHSSTPKTHHEADEGDAHLTGTIVGVAAGLLLLSGHLLNIRATRRRREECCT